MKIAVIINSGSKLARSELGLDVVKRKLTGVLHSIAITASADEAANMLRRAVLDGIDTAVVAGGDGTVNGVLNVFAGTEIALGIIPAGTANDLASLHRLPADLAAACDLILQRQLKVVDLISVNGRCFVTAGGLGFPSIVAANANALKSRRRVGTLARTVLRSELYLLSAGLSLLGKAGPTVHLTIQSDHSAINVDCLALMVTNQPFVGRHFYVAPGAASDDEHFGVCLVENPRSRIELAAILLHALRGSHANLPSVTTWRARALQVRASEPLPFYADGEHLDTRDQFAVHIAPRALHLIVPALKTERRAA